MSDDALKPSGDISRLLRPRSIAIVGVSDKPGTTGGNVLGSLENFDYAGRVHLISRNRTEVLGRPCFPTVDAMPEDLDLAVICLPRSAAVEAIAGCARRRVGAVILFASGFAEQDEAGQAEQDEIARIARGHGIALLGPNCLGIQNERHGVSLGLGLAQRPPSAPRRVVAIVSQSGGMGVALGAALRQRGLAATYIVSTGNEAALGIEEILEDALADDEATVLAVLAEHLRQPRRFLDIAARARRAGKPIVLLHPGASTKAQEAARTHTGALAADHAVMRALVAHEAVVLVDSFDEWVDVSALLGHYPHPPTAGIGVVTNSGAFRGIVFDLCEDLGLAVPELMPATAEALRGVIPSFARASNPLDVTAQTAFQRDLVGAAVKPMLDDPGIGSLVVALVGGAGPIPVENARHAIPHFRASPKPVVYSIFAAGSTLAPELEPMLQEPGVPFFRSPEAAVRAVARITAYGKALQTADRRARPSVSPPPLPARGTLMEYQGKAWLAAAGIATPPGGLATNFDAAEAIARRIDYPVALKAQSLALPHKSDAGGVILDLNDAAALERGWSELHANIRRSRPDLALDGVLVETMAKRGVEMVVGGRRNPLWGPVLLVGLGGIWIETLHDVRLMPPDLTKDSIADEIGKLRGAALLFGTRGAPPADIGALAQTVARIGALMLGDEAIEEIDINPLMVYPRGQGVLALDALIVTR
jgi:acetate---CoA ligase (ADP-forming)